MRVAVTGRKGQVVRSLCERGPLQGHDIVPLGRPEVDLIAHPDRIAAAIELARPDVIVSAAAYTAVDQAETEQEAAFAVNERGARAVARAARQLHVPLIHLSTDYVFDGSKCAPYAEEDETGPTGVYGASKLAGEKAVIAEHDDLAVLRTAWVYSPFGTNFVKTMLSLARGENEVRVVSDQVGNPTSALDIADGILVVAANLLGSGDREKRGIFHMTASGEASWAQLAEQVFASSAAAEGPTAKVIHIGSSDFPTAARRPANSRLDCKRLEQAHGLRLPDWRRSTKKVVARLIAEESTNQELK